MSETIGVSPRDLIIVGTSLFGEIAHEYFTHDSSYNVVAFSVERDYLEEDEFRSLPVVPFETLAETFEPTKHSIFVAVTYSQLNRTRTRLLDRAVELGFSPASYISSSAFVWRNVTLGEHCFIFEDNTLQPFVTVGRNCVLWSGNHIGHHSRLGNNLFISSHVVISGSVSVGDNCFLGVNSTIVNDIEIGTDTWLGPGAVITRSVDPNTMWRAPRSEMRDVSTRQVLKVPE